MSVSVLESSAADPPSLTPLLRENGPWVEAVARRHLGDAALAEEVRQDVFLRLAGLPRVPEDPAALRSWLLRTVWFLSANARRKAARRRSVEACAARELRPAEEMAGGEPGDLPLEELEGALDCLPDLERALVLEHYFEGRQHGEIGGRHRLSAEAARKRITRALGRMRSHLTRRGVAMPVGAVLALLGTVVENSRAASAAAGAAARAAQAAACWCRRGAGAAWKKFLGQTVSSAPSWKIASLTAASCASVALPLLIHQQGKLRDLEKTAAASAAAGAARERRHDFPGGAFSPESAFAGLEEGAWRPGNLHAEGFPQVPPLTQWLMDSLPVLAAAAAESGEPLNLRVSIRMSESVSRQIQQRRVGLIDLDRVLAELQRDCPDQKKLDTARERTRRELLAREERTEEMRSSLAGLEAENPAALRDGHEADSKSGDRSRPGASDMSAAGALQWEIARQPLLAEEFRTRRQLQLEDAEVRMRKGLRERILEQVQQKTRRGQYEMILDSGALLSGGGGTLFSPDGGAVDISAEILEEVRRAFATPEMVEKRDGKTLNP